MPLGPPGPGLRVVLCPVVPASTGGWDWSRLPWRLELLLHHGPLSAVGHAWPGHHEAPLERQQPARARPAPARPTSGGRCGADGEEGGGERAPDAHEPAQNVRPERAPLVMRRAASRAPAPAVGYERARQSTATACTRSPAASPATAAWRSSGVRPETARDQGQEAPLATTHWARRCQGQQGRLPQVTAPALAEKEGRVHRRPRAGHRRRPQQHDDKPPAPARDEPSRAGATEPVSTRQNAPRATQDRALGGLITRRNARDGRGRKPAGPRSAP